jgi:hypothetical protein
MPHTSCLATCLSELNSAGRGRWFILGPLFIFSFLCDQDCVLSSFKSHTLLHIFHICLVTAVYFLLQFPDRLCPILIPTIVNGTV